MLSLQGQIVAPHTPALIPLPSKYVQFSLDDAPHDKVTVLVSECMYK